MTFDALVLASLRAVGLVMLILVAINILVPYRYRWREDMATLTLLNRQIFQAHNVFLILTLGLVAVLLLGMPDVLLERTRGSRALLVGLTIFFGLRMLMQWWFFSPELWRGHRFNATVHVIFSITWTYVTATFAAAWFVTR